MDTWQVKERIRDFEERIPAIFSEDLKEYMVEGGFFTCPASAGHHGAFEGGNFWHSRMVAMLLREYTDRFGLEWERPESPEIIGWLHDLCKMDEYIEYIIEQDGKGKTVYKHKISTLPGHGEKSVMMAERFMYLTEEEVHCICWHMGAFTGKDLWDGYTEAVRKYPNILWTHQADMVASNVNGI